MIIDQAFCFDKIYFCDGFAVCFNAHVMAMASRRSEE
jgi:hypothetical protein